ncbi:MAG: hypothetical protein LBD07_00865 [Spirochaetaceae bacterium]|jgi:hypothetical protein|nr:hypothetical protein [Spirochaetaceae bacterium]
MPKNECRTKCKISFLVTLVIVVGAAVFITFGLKTNAANKIFAFGNRKSKQILIAHQGLAAYHFENTLDAFIAAGEEPSFGAIETDIWFTRDNRIAAVHTVDTLERAKELSGMGVDYITINYPNADGSVQQGK